MRDISVPFVASLFAGLVLGAAGLAAAQPAPELPLQSDKASMETNEVVLRLNYDGSARSALARLTPELGSARSETEVEALALRAFNQGQSADLTGISPRMQARFLLAENRMTDKERAAHELARAAGQIPADAEDPRLKLNQYIVVRVSNIAAASALVAYARQSGVAQYAQINRLMSLSAVPTDSFFSWTGGGTAVPAQYQWGMRTGMMDFPNAWNISKGHAYVGVLDVGWPGTTSGGVLTPHPDLVNSFRPQMIDIAIGSNPTSANHTVHVTGIIGAQHDNGHGVAGGCPNCSVVPYPFQVAVSEPTSAHIASRIVAAVDGGMQIINWSGGAPTGDCTAFAEICSALSWANLRQVLVVVAAGNDRNTLTTSGGPQFPGQLGDGYPVLPVGGINTAGARWDTGLPGPTNEIGTNNPSNLGLMAPAELVVSTFNAGQQHSPLTQSSCSDNPALDGSFPRFAIANDGYGTCTGTSMSAPHVTAAAALVRSAYPRASVNDVRTRLRQAGSIFPSPTHAFGYGIVNAYSAVLNTVSLLNPYRLTPLYSYFSSSRKDSFYTTKPQMARAAAWGTMLPKVAGTTQASNKYDQTYGYQTSGPQLPISTYFEIGPVPDMSKAEVWVFTTNLNPANAAVPLTPLVRMSWRCGDTAPNPAVCSTNPSHVDNVLVKDTEVGNFQAAGYRVDGIEGYIYPNTAPQPLNTVRLLKRYNPALDDHAVFPETALSTMVANGYTTISGLDWLGYVYANPATGAMPTY